MQAGSDRGDSNAPNFFLQTELREGHSADG
jgi:hypothetical protein